MFDLSKGIRGPKDRPIQTGIPGRPHRRPDIRVLTFAPGSGSGRRKVGKGPAPRPGPHRVAARRA